ncbi:hypothetical protein BH23VER1_BH23VER1_35130 [soil metagenome]
MARSILGLKEGEVGPEPASREGCPPLAGTQTHDDDGNLALDG